MTEDHHQVPLVQPDLTLLGNQIAERVDDIVAFRSTGKTVATVYEPNPNNAAAIRAVFPKQESMHAIEDYCDRDTLIEVVEFGPSVTKGDIFGTYDVMELVRTHDNLEFLRNKLEGFYGVTFDCQLTCLVNAQPFEQGVFQIVFIPFEDNFTSLPALVATSGDAERTLPFSTGCPNTYIQLPLQSECSLKIPYVGPTPFINITKRDAGFGKFYLQCLTPLDSATSAPKLNVSVMLRFSNIQPYGATGTTWQGLQPQGLEDIVGEIAQTVQPGNIISAAINTAAPELKIGVDTALAMSKTALQGLSKPTIPLTQSRVVINPYDQNAVHDTGSSVIKFSLCKDQSVRVDQIGIDKKDEMDIRYFVSKPTYLTSIPWGDTMPHLTPIGYFKAEPNTDSTLYDANTKRVFPTRFRYASNFFSAWRGTTRFTFKVVCTQYHIGRLRFVYITGRDSSITNDESMAPPKLPLSYTFFVDIHGPVEFALDCGYYASTLWRGIPHQFQTNGGISGSDFTYIPREVGTDWPNELHCFVETPLRTNEAVASKSVEIIVFQSGCSDIEFAGPTANTSPPLYVMPPAGRSDTAFRYMDDSDEESVTARRVTPQGPDDRPVHNMCGYTTASKPDDFAGKVTFGERIDSFRAMLRRYQPLGRIFETVEHVDALYPYMFRFPNSTDTLSYNFLEGLLPCYAFYRGSMRYQAQTSSDSFCLQVAYDPQPLSTRINDADVGNLAYGPIAPAFHTGIIPHAAFTHPFAATQPFHTFTQGGASFETPYYSIFDKIRSSFVVNTGVPGSDRVMYESYQSTGRAPFGSATIAFSDNNSSTGVVKCLSRAAGDDFTLGYALGAPPTTFNINSFPGYYKV